MRLLLLWGLSLLLICSAQAKRHKVRAGESLWPIARRYGCTVNQLRHANGLKEGQDLLQIGQRLRIPWCKGKPKKLAKIKGREERRKRRKKRLSPGRHKTDTETLERLMRAQGFRPPSNFKALILEITLNRKQTRILSERPFSWKKTYDDWQGWNPASTVKLYPAISALERVRAKGFNPLKTKASFFDRRGRRKRTYSIRELVLEALDKSNNIFYNRLVQLAGYARLNGQFFTRRRGFRHSGIHKPYERSKWVPMTGLSHFSRAPKIQLHQGRRMRSIYGGKSKGKFHCPYSGACTSLADLTSTMRRLMLHEQLPKRQRFRLKRAELDLLRSALARRHKRGMEVVDTFTKALRKESKGKVVFFHKPGYSEGWMSDIIYVYLKGTRRRWIVALAGYKGRGALNSAAHHIAALLADDAFIKE